MGPVAEADLVRVLAGPLAGLTGYVDDVDPVNAVAHVRAEGLEPAAVPFSAVEVLPRVKQKTYDQVLRDIEAAILDGREPTDEELAVLDAQLHAPVIRSRMLAAKRP